MSDASKAVFLSYASQDADAARRICEALRAAGVEVWFDQSGPLGGPFDKFKAFQSNQPMAVSLSNRPMAVSLSNRLGALSPSTSSGPFLPQCDETVSLSNGSSNGLRGGDAWDSRCARSFEFWVLGSGLKSERKADR